MAESEITVERLGYLRLLAIRDPQDAFFALGDGELEALIAMAERGMEAKRRDEQLARDLQVYGSSFQRISVGGAERIDPATVYLADDEEQPHG